MRLIKSALVVLVAVVLVAVVLVAVVLVAVVLVAVIAVVGLLASITARALPQVKGSVSAPGLEAPVTVVRDDAGIAHITADSAHDLFFAQAYVHASERMWQMEVWRHISAGRLSELFGASQLDTDKFIRTLGWRDAAQHDLDAAGEAMRAVFAAYTAGVNAWLDGHRQDLGLAFIASGSAPEPWTDLDTLAWAKVQAWNLGSNFSTEVFRYLADSALGDPARVDELFPAYRDGAPVITPGGLPGSGGAGLASTAELGRHPFPGSATTPFARLDPAEASGGDRWQGSVTRPWRSRAWTSPAGWHPTTASARTTGWWLPAVRSRAARCLPTTRIWASRCRRSGSSRGALPDGRRVLPV